MQMEIFARSTGRGGPGWLLRLVDDPEHAHRSLGKGGLLMRSGAIIVMLVTFVGSSSAWGQGGAPTLLSYQGQLLTSAGAPITTATVVRFTLLWGGTETENPSTGRPVYQEDVTLIPDGGGVFHHLIGAGAPTAGCDENRDGTPAEPCVLAANDLPSDGTVVYLELRIDPAGANNLLSPRQRVASVAYALNSATLDGQAASDFITGVNAGSGLSGGGTSGDVTLAIPASGVSSIHLARDSVTTAHILAGAVTGPKIAGQAVTTSHLAANAVGAAQIQSNAVNSDKVANGTLTTEDVGKFSGSITFNFGSIAAGSCAAISHSPGGPFSLDNDVILVTASSAFPPDLFIEAQHQTPSSFLLKVCNQGGTTIDPPSATFYWVVFNLP